MIKAAKSDKQVVTEILAASFSNNRSVNYVIAQNEKKMDRIRKLMAYSFDVCLHLAMFTFLIAGRPVHWCYTRIAGGLPGKAYGGTLSWPPLFLV